MTANSPSSPLRCAAGGFTLIEVILAATIFAITVSALFVTFRTGVRAWQSGHAASELFQTARIAQDVVIRDLNNVSYRSELEYNQTFRNQIRQLAAMQAAVAEALDPVGFNRTPTPTPPPNVTFIGAFVPNAEVTPTPPPLTLDGIAAPIDLTFIGEDGGDLDTLSFSRYHRSRSARDALAGGILRVRYYVEEGILYREESAPYGFRPGEDLAHHYAMQSGQEQLTRLFYGPGSTPEPTPGAEPAEAFGTLDGGGANYLPDRREISEPLCEGVEIFNITYGYNRFDRWNEVDNWDSSNFTYRFPEDERGDVDPMTGEPIVPLVPTVPIYGQPSLQQTGRTETIFNPTERYRPQMAIVNGQPIRFSPRPDNLPGYVAIQLGLRDPSGKGRLRSFTFFISMPMAREEFDTSSIDDIEQPGFARPTEFNPPGGSTNLIIR